MQKKQKMLTAILMTAILLIASAIPAYAAPKEVPVTSVTYPKEVKIFAGDTKTLNLTPNPANTTYKSEITWTVSGSCIKVTKSGKGTKTGSTNQITIKALKTGKATVAGKFRFYDKAGNLKKMYARAATIIVSPKAAMKSLGVSRASATLNVGNKLTLTAKPNPANAYPPNGIAWSSSNKNIASVNEKGVVTARRPGSCTITASANGKKATCKLTIKAPVLKLSADKTAVTIPEGGNAGIGLSFVPSNTTDTTTTWTSSNTRVATVSGGRIYGQNQGTCTVTAKKGTKSVSIKVTVKYVAPTFVDASRVLTRINLYRRFAGRAELKRDATLDYYAQIRAKELVQKFDHVRPNGQRGLNMISIYLWRGENIAKGQPTADAVANSWYSSADHRANFLTPQYTKTGIAGYKYRDTVYWVQMFSSG